MAQSPIGVAVVGTGFGQKIHLPGFQVHPRTQVMAIYNRDLEKAKAIAAEHKIPHASNSLAEILALPEVKAVSISTPPFLHYDMAKAALQAGKHVLLEKPTTMNATEAEELYRLASAQDVVGVLNFEFRYIPTWMRFAELLQDGYVGEKRLIKIDWLASGRANANRPWNWYSRQDQGGGTLGAIGSHTFDYIAWLFGPAKRLWGWLNTGIPARPDPETGDWKAVDTDDTCSILLELADGTPCQISLSAVTYRGRGHWVEVYGDRGTLVLGNDNQSDYVHGFKLLASQSGNPLSEVDIPDRLAFPNTYSDGRLAPFIRVVEHFVQCIDRNQSSAPSFKEGLYSQLLMDLTHASSQRGSWVEVPSLNL